MVITVIAVVAAYGEAHPSTPGTYFTGQHHLPHTPDAALLLVAAGGVVLAWRHRYPRLVLCASTAVVVAYTLPGYENGVALLLPAVAMGTLAADPSTTALRSSAWAVAVTAVLMAATASNNPLGQTGGGFFLIPANLAVALFAGLAIGSRRAYLDSERAQLARQAAQEAQRGIDEERVRIARELHDVVAHTMATITVQASAATTLLRDRPEQAAESLQAIRAASKNGLRELRAILNVLRAASGDSDGFVDPVQPAAGLARLDALAAGVRAAGLPVTVTVTGHPRDLPAVTDLSAYRIIQEALTNAISHAGPATAAVTVHYAADSLAVEVTDTGCGLLIDRGDRVRGLSRGRHRRRARPARYARARRRRRRRHGDRPAARPGFPGRRPLPARPARRSPRPRRRSPRRATGRADSADPRRLRRQRPAGRPPVIRVLLADDQKLIRAGFRVLLEAAADVEVVGEAVNGEEAVALARAERPDVIMMDIRMPEVDGLEATRRIAADGDLAGVKVVILTTFETDDYVYQALRAGASGFLVKDAEPEDLIRAVRVVARGEALLSPSVTRRLIATFASRARAAGRAASGRAPQKAASVAAPRRPRPGCDLSRITEREREVLSLVAEGLSNDEIATRLYLSPLTTKTHVSRIMTKLDARDRAQLVVIAYESGLVVPGSAGI